MLAVQAPVDSRGTLLDRWREARTRTDELFNLVREDSLYDRPIPERHRIVFYIGHLEAFDWNLLQPGKSFDSGLDRLFAFGIDPVDGGLPSDQPSDWPKLADVRRYAAGVRQALDLGMEGEARLSETLLNTAIEHRLMHAETLAYMLHQTVFDRSIE